MTARAPAKCVTVEQYLSNPDYKHYENVDGKVLELNLGTIPHSTIKGRCAALITNHVDTLGRALAAMGLRCRLTVNGRLRFRQPDICVFFNLQAAEMRYLEGAPEFVIEVRSPDDTIRELTRKIDEYFANGCKLPWLILPEEQTVEVFTPAAPTKAFGPGDKINGGDVIPGLKLAVADLFAPAKRPRSKK
jgi:Uma2 family endonuclease